ncbi:hypothetical protein KJ866_02875 [Patescibacteria group bacterium]|nr:hypothetical protein [Patescibacteria group bacterium]MBU2220278.1 hypothetical protein [Patescibacteria group bacterium]
MSIEQPNAFENKTIVKDGAVEVQEEKRPNLEALEKKRDEYILSAIKEFEKQKPKEFTKENIPMIAGEIFFILEKKHGVYTDAIVSPGKKEERTPAEQKEIDNADEFIETYRVEHIEEILNSYFAEKTK